MICDNRHEERRDFINGLCDGRTCIEPARHTVIRATTAVSGGKNLKKKQNNYVG